MEAISQVKGWSLTYGVSFLPYSMGQSSFKPAHIQKEGKQVLILDEWNVKKFIAIFKPLYSLLFQFTYSKEHSVPFVTEEYNQENILYPLLYA